MNNVIVTGNLCRDIDLRKTGEDISIGRTAIAVRRDKEVNEDGTHPSDFFDVTLFGKQADFAAKYTRKGSKVLIRGSIRIRDYVNKDNIKCRALEIVGDAIELLDKKEDDKPIEDKPSSEPQGENLQELDLPDDDLPF